MTRQELSLRGKLGAHALHAQHDSHELTQPARTAFNDRFYRQVDPDGTLARTNPRELAKRVEHARSAYFAGLALKSVQARQAKARQKREQQAAQQAPMAA